MPSLLWKNLTYPFSGAAAEARFDRRYGIETAASPHEIRDGMNLGIPLRHGAALIASVMPEATDFVFIDIGCSKGRALALARQHPFGRVIGIERDPYFAAIARRNATAIGGVEIVEADAFAYELPSDPTVFFLHRPFPLEVAEQMGRHIVASLHARPRKVFVLFYSYEFPVSLEALRQREIRLPHDPTERFKESHFRGRIFAS